MGGAQAEFLQRQTTTDPMGGQAHRVSMGIDHPDVSNQVRIQALNTQLGIRHDARGLPTGGSASFTTGGFALAHPMDPERQLTLRASSLSAGVEAAACSTERCGVSGDAHLLAVGAGFRTVAPGRGDDRGAEIRGGLGLPAFSAMVERQDLDGDGRSELCRHLDTPAISGSLCSEVPFRDSAIQALDSAGMQLGIPALGRTADTLPSLFLPEELHPLQALDDLAWDILFGEER